jgi:hypothetical protein
MTTEVPKGYDLVIEVRERQSYSDAGAFYAYSAKLTDTRINLWHPEGKATGSTYHLRKVPGVVGYRLTDLHKVCSAYNKLPVDLLLVDLGPATSPEIVAVVQKSLAAMLRKRQADGDRNAAQREHDNAQRALLDAARDGVTGAKLAKLADAYRAAWKRAS